MPFAFTAVQITQMPTPTVRIRSDSFAPTQASQSVLCLEVGRDRFRFMVQDRRQRGCWLEDYTFPTLLTERMPTDVLADIVRTHPILTAGPWQEIRVAINSPSFPLIPQPLFRKEYAGSYLELMRGTALPAHEFAQAYAHPAEGYLSVFNMSHTVADYFSEVYPLQPVTFIHQVGALLTATAALPATSAPETAISLYFEDEFVTAIGRRAGALQYCNRFGYKNAHDLVYYLLYVLTELQLDLDTTPISLYGEITPFADAYTELSRFLPTLQFGQRPAALALTHEFNDLPDHRYLSLYGLCLMGD